MPILSFNNISCQVYRHYRMMTESHRFFSYSKQVEFKAKWRCIHLFEYHFLQVSTQIDPNRKVSLYEIAEHLRPVVWLRRVRINNSPILVLIIRNYKCILKRGCQHPLKKFEILWLIAQNSFSLLLSYFVAQHVLIIVV